MKSKFYEKLLQLKDDNGLCVKEYCFEEENQIYTELLNQKKELPIGKQGIFIRLKIAFCSLQLCLSSVLH